MLIFGGELNDFARRLMYVVLVGILGATQIVGPFGRAASIGEVAGEAPQTTQELPMAEHGSKLDRSRIHRAPSRPTPLGADREPSF